MATPRAQFVCQECGGIASRWVGRCPECGAWNTMVEEAAPRTRDAAVRTAPGANQALPISEVPMEGWDRSASGIGELDRVLGGGIVPGSLVLIGGDPGIGKSTLLLQAAARLAGQARVLYVTGEESAQQIRLRAERLHAMAPELLILAETDLAAVQAATVKLQPAYVVLDSIQTAYDPDITSAPGTVSQVRACCTRLMRLAKEQRTTIFLVGHVTKEGTLAGPRVLEHMVDTVLYFEGDRFQSHRILRAVKNRFGSTDEVGLFEMSDAGLREVSGASELFLGQRAEAASGSAVVAVIEGTRPMLLEVQALVAKSHLTMPRRTTSGVDPQRVSLILAVLERRCGLRLGDKDVFVNVTGGVRVVEPATDLAVAVALASSYRARPVEPTLVLAGEVGLAGEVRSVSQVDRRVREAARMGFSAFMGAAAPAGSTEIPFRAHRHLRSALEDALADERPAAGEDPFAEG